MIKLLSLLLGVSLAASNAAAQSAPASEASTEKVVMITILSVGVRDSIAIMETSAQTCQNVEAALAKRDPWKERRIRVLCISNKAQN